ncbi:MULTISPECIES: aminotransferase class IV [unclassified Arsukibacterium]|uniref:aminotransferase class IV n=1 Tax=unclassified Arsukibacterium TaxID=2635278 RepID=UPI000C59CB4B|nr:MULTISPECIES: aminotransferase class IV [unclassified Arsukibacterium]MAA94231.1 D-alanine aminotransferase [Rheinheimera sp.]MBM34950.1 D-alanine aminotransferase [Rheinheimera sp.]HAW93297.1 D-alanine aminotransferase [Candidatus Azambacteria bacterium]|tara:strand:+ start:22779 stop:23645 length:867 start_codon:yes stop_codon:yes gene_type:complete
MSIVYLNGDFIPAAEAKISPMDRGFLFGDGIYEVIPSYGGRFVGFKPHIARMQDGLSQLSIDPTLSLADWQRICQRLLSENQQINGDNQAVYIQVSRGTDSKRNHAFPANIKATVFAYAFAIAPEPIADKSKATTFNVVTGQDLRWQRCHIKSTSLLGNVLHYQQGYASGAQEILLFDKDGNLTEGAAVNVFVIKDGVIATPPLTTKLLPGITRLLLLNILRKHSSVKVEERDISEQEVFAADEIWLTSSSKEIAPVLKVNEHTVGTGEVGDIWLAAQQLFSAHKYDE